MSTACTHIHTHLRTHMRTYMCTHMRTHMQAVSQRCLRVHALSLSLSLSCTCAHTYIHTHGHTPAHTTHAYTVTLRLAQIELLTPFFLCSFTENNPCLIFVSSGTKPINVERNHLSHFVYNLYRTLLPMMTASSNCVTYVLSLNPCRGHMVRNSRKCSCWTGRRHDVCWRSCACCR